MDDLEKGVKLIYATGVTRERGSEIEAKSVHVHLEHPIAQAVHHELERARMQQVKGIARAGEIHVEARIIRLQPVVGLVVNAPERERRSEVVSFRGVIINNIKNHFDPGGVKITHHRFEFRHLPAQGTTAGVFSMRREKPNGVVAPVIR